jgi:hypothetical protein
MLLSHHANALRQIQMLGAGERSLMSDSLPVLAGVLRTPPESDALVILGRLLDSLPIPVLLTDCSEELRCVYGNAAWRSWVPLEKFPIEPEPGDRRHPHLSHPGETRLLVPCRDRGLDRGAAAAPGGQRTSGLTLAM